MGIELLVPLTPLIVLILYYSWIVYIVFFGTTNKENEEEKEVVFIICSTKIGQYVLFKDLRHSKITPEEEEVLSLLSDNDWMLNQWLIMVIRCCGTDISIIHEAHERIQSFTLGFYPMEKAVKVKGERWRLSYNVNSFLGEFFDAKMRVRVYFAKLYEPEITINFNDPKKNL